MDIRGLLLDLIEDYYDTLADGGVTDIWWWTDAVNAIKVEYNLMRVEVQWLVKRINRFIERIDGKGCFELYIVKE